MATQTTQVAFPPLDSQATTSLIEANVAEGDRTGDIQTDFKKALISLLGLSGSGYSLDDLWKRYQLSSTVTGDTDVQGPPSRTPPGHGGQHPRHFLPPGRLKNADNANGFPGASGGGAEPAVQEIPDIDAVTFTLEQTSAALGTGMWAGWPAPDGTAVYFMLNPFNTIHKRNLSTPWDLSTMSVSDDGVSAEATDNVGFYDRAFLFSTTQQKLWCSNYGNQRLYQYNYSTADPLDMPASYSVQAIPGGASNMDWSFTDNGSKVMLYDNVGLIRKHSLSTPYDFATIGALEQTSTSIVSNGRVFIWHNDGTRCWVMVAGTINQYKFTTPWDLSTRQTGTTSALPATMTSGVPNAVISNGFLWTVDENSDAIRKFSWA